jgi:hypothetical protein
MVSYRMGASAKKNNYTDIYTKREQKSTAI